MTGPAHLAVTGVTRRMSYKAAALWDKLNTHHRDGIFRDPKHDQLAVSTKP